MNFDYNTVKQKCIEWYAKEGGMYSATASPISSTTNIEHDNYFGDKTSESKFQKHDLTIIRKGEYSKEGYLYFITSKSFNPTAGVFTSSWSYQGHILRIKTGGVEYITTPSLIQQQKLKKLEQRV